MRAFQVYPSRCWHRSMKEHMDLVPISRLCLDIAVVKTYFIVVRLLPRMIVATSALKIVPIEAR